MTFFHKVLVGVDGRQGGRDAIALGKLLAASSARLVLANVYLSQPKYAGSNVLPDPVAHAEELLNRARDDAGVATDTIVRGDDWPANGLHAIAEEEHADVLVVGSSHRGALGRVFIGDDSRAALHGAPCAVAIAPQGYASQDPRWEKIVVGHDGSAESEAALAAARSLSGQHGAAIQLISAIELRSVPVAEAEPADWTSATESAARAERERLSAIEGVESEVAYGEPYKELAKAATDAGLLVVGSRSRGPVGRLIEGSTSNHLARHSPCPLLVTPRRRTS
jgi:nucleotide-binding universal stress UspA family protein